MNHPHLLNTEMTHLRWLFFRSSTTFLFFSELPEKSSMFGIRLNFQLLIAVKKSGPEGHHFDVGIPK